MLDKYNKLFNMYLKICKGKYDKENPYENLERCIRIAENCKWELVGMIKLIQEMGEITFEEMEKETDRIFDEFNTIKLFNASLEHGEIMVYV